MLTKKNTKLANKSTSTTGSYDENDTDSTNSDTDCKIPAVKTPPN